MSLDYLDKLGKAREDIQEVATTPIGKAAEEFTKTLIDQMKENVPKAGTQGNLAASIQPTIKFEGPNITILIEMNDYWDFVNAGVDGVEQSAGAKTNVFGSTYSFKNLGVGKSMLDSFKGTGSFFGWMAQKGITSLTFGGETHQLVTESDFKSAAYVLARATKKKGIQPSGFVDDALSEEKIQGFEEKLLDAFEQII